MKLYRKKRSLKKKIVDLLMILGAFFFLILIFNNQIKYAFINNKVEMYTKSITSISPNEIKKNEEKKAVYDIDKVVAVSDASLLESVMNTSEYDNSIVGFVSVPSVGVYVTIFKGLANSNLLYGAGTVKPDQKMGEGNYVLASHKLENPNLLFTPLLNSVEGQNIYLTDKTNIYRYEIKEKLVVLPTRGDLMDDEVGKKLITLITCYDMSGEKRFIVRGELKEAWEYKKAPQNVVQAFSQNY
ncbi:class A sortase [Enterococcus faecalis]|jgi:sortase A|uniref:class A sortase n=1 Tax=Enterococcus faecium TaxID=1352 RepID=UPI001F1E9592|nr:class A sortase [Enterococcus faecium]EKZ0201707.1 class A sortase [Enterococcus faecalis]MCF8636724.1 class A sortase [Enterococcus faecium]HAQ5747091.1 class A sortase [Enterococcus faecium]